MRKYIILSIVLFLLFFAVKQPAAASFCRNINGKKICILSIKRSAKNQKFSGGIFFGDIQKEVEHEKKEERRAQRLLYAAQSSPISSAIFIASQLQILQKCYCTKMIYAMHLFYNQGHSSLTYGKCNNIFECEYAFLLIEMLLRFL